MLEIFGHEEGLGQVNSAAGGPVPRSGQARSLHIHHRLGRASDSPRLPLPPSLEKAAECRCNLLAWYACSHIHLGVEGHGWFVPWG